MSITKMLALLLFSATVTAQVNVIEVFKKTNEDPAFSGDMTPSEIVSELYSKKIEKGDGELKVEVSIPVIKNKKVIAQDISGLPAMTNSNGEMADDSVATIPFVFEPDSQSFVEYLMGMDTVLESLEQSVANKSSASCGGFPLGSTVTTTWTSYQLCTQIKTTTTCMIGANNIANWFITEQVVSVPIGCWIEP